MSENAILKLYDSLISQLSRLDNKVSRSLERIEQEISSLDHRVADLETTDKQAKEIKTELLNDIREIKQQWKIYRKYFILVALGTLVTASAVFGYEKVIYFIKRFSAII